MQRLEKYVGRIVRLNKQAFQEICKRSRCQKGAVENCFVVAAVSREIGKLICYGANLRIAVGASEVVLI